MFRVGLGLLTLITVLVVLGVAAVVWGAAFFWLWFSYDNSLCMLYLY